MIRSCDTCGVVAFNTETGACGYCADVAASEAAKAKAAGSDTPELLNGSVAVVVAALEAVAATEQLDALAVAEAAGKNRKGVLEAIAARKSALAAVTD